MGKLFIGGSMINFRKLKDLREDNDLSQAEIAYKLGVNRSTYSLWELGINVIPLKYLCKCADFYKTNIDYILGLNFDRNVKSTSGLDLKVLGENIKKLRRLNNLSQDNLASVLHVSQAAIAKYEKGVICISTYNLYILSLEFNVSMSFLTGKVLNLKEVSV